MVQILIHWTTHQMVCFFVLQFPNNPSNAQSWNELPLLTLHKSAGLSSCKVGLATVTQPFDDACISFNDGQLFCRPLKVTRSPTSRSSPPNTTPRTCPRIHWTHTLKEEGWWGARCRGWYWPEITRVKTQLLKELIQLSTRSRMGRWRWPWGCWVPMANIGFWPQDGAASFTSVICVMGGHSIQGWHSQVFCTTLAVTASAVVPGSRALICPSIQSSVRTPVWVCTAFSTFSRR